MSTLRRRIEGHFDHCIEAQRGARDTLAGDVARACALLAGALEGGGKILACGNGGSASEAQHLVAELVGRFERVRSPYHAISLSADIATLTSIANDDGYDEVFATQVRAIGRPGDVLVALSTSGNSANVLQAVQAAGSLGMGIVALTGREGGKLAPLLGHGCIELRAPSDLTPRIQEVHLTLIHCLCDGIDEILAPPDLAPQGLTP